MRNAGRRNSPECHPKTRRTRVTAEAPVSTALPSTVVLPSVCTSLLQRWSHDARRHGRNGGWDVTRENLYHDRSHPLGTVAMDSRETSLHPQTKWCDPFPPNRDLTGDEERRLSFWKDVDN